MKKINIGIIGSGFIVPVFISVSKLVKGYHLRAIWGRHEEKLLQYKDEVDYLTTDLEKILSDETIDAIYVALPNKLHYEYALKALEHGKHVILENPFTVYYDEAKDKYHFACFVSDAAACCRQGIEFILEGDNVYPEDYPAEGAEITIQGVFGTYEEDGGTYWSLTGARFI